MGGYLVKVPDPNDKSSVSVSLTPAGKQIEEKIDDALPKFQQKHHKIN